MLRKIHVSHAEAFSRCPTEYQLRHVFGVELGGYIPPLARGGAMHAACAVLRERQGFDDAMQAAAAELAARGIETLPALSIEWETATVWAMLRGYVERWNGSMVYTGANEVQFTAPLINPDSGRPSRTFELEGTVDGLLLRDGAWSLYEMKTTSDTLHETEAYLREGIQIPVYDELVHRAKGIELQSNVIDLIKKPVTRKRKADTPHEWAKRAVEDYRADPDRFFRRVELDVDESRIRWAMGVMWRIAEQIRDADRRGYLAVRGWSCCKRGSGWCPLKSLCWYGADIEDNAKQGKQGEQGNDESTGNEGTAA